MFFTSVQDVHDHGHDKITLPWKILLPRDSVLQVVIYIYSWVTKSWPRRPNKPRENWSMNYILGLMSVNIFLKSTH